MGSAVCTYAAEMGATLTAGIGLLRSQSRRPTLRRLILAPPLLSGAGASDVGSAVCTYAAEKDADLVVVGSRGLGAVARSVMGFLGLGSVRWVGVR